VITAGLVFQLFFPVTKKFISFRFQFVQRVVLSGKGSPFHRSGSCLEGSEALCLLVFLFC